MRKFTFLYKIELWTEKSLYFFRFFKIQIETWQSLNFYKFQLGERENHFLHLYKIHLGAADSVTFLYDIW